MRTPPGLRLSLGLTVLLAFTACAAPADEDASALERRVLELDDMGTAPAGMELFVLAPDADLERLRETAERLNGSFVHVLPPRLVVGRVPPGADALLAQSGVLQRFARAVSPTELADLDVREARFVRVFSSRYYPDATPRDELVAPRHLPRVEGEPFEASENPSAPPLTSLRFKGGDDDQAEQNERGVFVPYASGRIVVSVILPESNGRAEESSEDWSEEAIAEVYAKVQAGLETIQRHEPNAQLSFILHYESQPANGGFEGTVDVDWEYGKQAWGGANLAHTYAQIFSRITGRAIVEYEYWQAQSEYLSGLKERYAADGAFIVYVGANHNQTAGFRAYASFNGPSTSLDSTYGYEVFAHEFGHIFGAFDEYCPDACISPSSMHGYLGMVNANAEYRAGPYGGIRGGRGESQPSLMMYNIANGVNGYTRGAWGWLDTDGDGVIEVRDTLPTSDLRADVSGGEVRIVGRIVDVPATSNYAVPYSVNRIRALHVRQRGDASWVRLPLAGARRGREDVDLALGKLPSGHYELELRGENSVGNVQPTPTSVSFDVTSEAENAAPLVSLLTDTDVLSPAASARLTASVLELDGDPVELRFDLDGDGRYDTAFSEVSTVVVRPTRAGLVQLGVEVRDGRGETATAVHPLYVLEENAPARAALPALPSPAIGASSLRLSVPFAASDPEGERVELNYKLERDDASRSLSQETGFHPPAAREFELRTPLSLVATGIDLNALDSGIDRYAYVYDALRLTGTHVALALGELGLAIVDLADVKAPRLLARLELETAAYDLALVSGGQTLFAFGDKLTAVDVTNPEAPLEVLQRKRTWNERLIATQEPWPIDERGARPASLWSEYGERIEHAVVQVTLDHPRWQELRVALITPRGDSILLRDHVARRPGQRSFTIDARSHEGLRQLLVGQRAYGEFRVEVVDDVINGSSGSIVQASLRLVTTHRAFQPALDKPHGIVGSLRDGTLLVAGVGLQAVDTSRLDRLRGHRVLETEPVLKAVLVDDHVLVITHTDVKGEALHARKKPARPSGLFAVEVRRPQQLRVVRSDASVQAEGAFAVAGSRFYLPSFRSQTTRVGSIAAFVRGRPYWLGESPVVIAGDIAGDDRALWVANGPIERLDVENPASMRVLERFADPSAYATRFFDARTALVLGSAGELWQLDLAGRTSVLSEVYRLTVQARDARGVLSESSRSVHLVPYDRAPSIASARFVRATTTRDPYELEVTVTDPDEHPAWDGYQAVRVDWDGDGIYDGPWQGVWDVATLRHEYEEPGDYLVRVQARDGFHALSQEVLVPLHVEAYVPIPCASSEACPSDEFCRFPVGETPQQSCGGGQAVGECAERPLECFRGVATGRIGIPGREQVCGCDGITYVNACAADQAGVSLEHLGACDGAGSCVEQGCGEGEACMNCWAGWTCMPEGSTC